LFLNNDSELKQWESTTGLKQAKGTYIRTLCQKNEVSVEIKQRPIKMDGRTVYRTLSSKGSPFQTGIDG
jgi:hypothetical protein